MDQGLLIYQQAWHRGTGGGIIAQQLIECGMRCVVMRVTHSLEQSEQVVIDGRGIAFHGARRS